VKGFAASGVGRDTTNITMQATIVIYPT